MKTTTKILLHEAWDYCDWNDKSTGFMIEFMKDHANVSHDTVENFLLNNDFETRQEFLKNHGKPHYVTMGQDHVHKVNGHLIHKNVIPRFKALSAWHGRARAFAFFGPKFCFEYHNQQWNENDMRYFPGGYIDICEPKEEEQEIDPRDFVEGNDLI